VLRVSQTAFERIIQEKGGCVMGVSLVITTPGRSATSDGSDRPITSRLSTCALPIVPERSELSVFDERHLGVHGDHLIDAPHRYVAV
jgi:hypothetical protein